MINKNDSKKLRSANFELLRIIAMLMVVMIHALGRGGTLEAVKSQDDMVSYFFVCFLSALTYVSVNCFVLISGYFLIMSKLKISKILKLIIQVEFYSILGSIISLLFFEQDISFGLKELIYTLFPLTGETYWFATHYVLLLILVPFLNRLIHSMSQKELSLSLFMLIIVFSIIPTFFFWSRNVVGDGHNFTWFIILYFVAAYIKLYGLPFKRKTYLLAYIFISLGLATSRLVIGLFTTAILGMEQKVNLFYAYNSLPVLVSSICFFCIFENFNLKNNFFSKNCVFWGGLSFGVFLLHHHFVVREYIWQYINIPQKLEYGVVFAVIYMLLVVFGIFIVGCIVEKIRLVVMNKLRINQLCECLDLKMKN